MRLVGPDLATLLRDATCGHRIKGNETEFAFCLVITFKTDKCSKMTAISSGKNEIEYSAATHHSENQQKMS